MSFNLGSEHVTDTLINGLRLTPMSFSLGSEYYLIY